MSSLCLRTRLQKASIETFHSAKSILFLDHQNDDMIRFKKILLCLCSITVFKFACCRCNATYHSESCRCFKVRVSEHSGISLLMNKPSKSKKSTAVKGHMLM